MSDAAVVEKKLPYYWEFGKKIIVTCAQKCLDIILGLFKKDC